MSTVPQEWTAADAPAEGHPHPVTPPAKSPPPSWMSGLADRRDSALDRLTNPVAGLGFLLVVALLLGLSIASYQKVFTRTVEVTLQTDRIGSQMQTASDVKVRGLIVGEVRAIDVTSRGAELTLALQPDKVDLIPHDVSARLLPKTLFGERYVSLVVPDGDTARPIRAGDVIPQDRSETAIELEQVLSDLLPLLRTVQPEKLAATLNALSTTLEGRGERLGENLVSLQEYLKEINPKLPTIQHDISALADVADTYSEAAPEVLDAATALLTTNKTLVDQQDQLAGFLAGTAGFADTTTAFLSANGTRIIQAGRMGRPTLAVLAKYSPQYPCVTEAMAKWIPRIDEAWRDEDFHITLEVVPQRAAYQPGEEPAWGENRPATCNFLPNPPNTQEKPLPGKKFDDGTANPYGYESDPQPQYSAVPSALQGDAGASVVDPGSGLAGTAEEQRLVQALLRGSDGPGDALTTLLAGPMLRGSVVDQATDSGR